MQSVQLSSIYEQAYNNMAITQMHTNFPKLSVTAIAVVPYQSRMFSSCVKYMLSLWKSWNFLECAESKKKTTIPLKAKHVVEKLLYKTLLLA